MFIARQRPTRIPAFAWEAQPEEGPFSCPGCNTEVILKKGEKVAAHFAHISDASCGYGAGESEEHARDVITEKKLEEFFLLLYPFAVACTLAGL